MGSNALSRPCGAGPGNGWGSGRGRSPPWLSLAQTAGRTHKDSGRLDNGVRADNGGGGAGHALTTLTSRMAASQAKENLALPHQ